VVLSRFNGYPLSQFIAGTNKESLVESSSLGKCCWLKKDEAHHFQLEVEEAASTKSWGWGVVVFELAHRTSYRGTANDHR